MGYDLHITRAAEWHDNAGARIAGDEGLAVVDEDPELTLERSQGPHPGSGPSAHAEPSWLDWSDGNIHTKDRDTR